MKNPITRKYSMTENSGKCNVQKCWFRTLYVILLRITTLVRLMHTMYALWEWIKWVINFRAALLNLWVHKCKTVKLQNCISSYLPTNQEWVMYFKKAPEYLEDEIVLDSCIFPTYLKPGGLQLQPSFVISCSLLLLSQRKSDKRRNVRYKLRLHPLFPFPFFHRKFAMSEISVQLCQGRRRFETSVFFSVKINISTTGGFKVGFFQPDTNHP